MNITAYETEKAGPKKWLAHLDLGNDIYMSFFADCKVHAIQKAEDWYNRERARQLRLMPEAGMVAALSSNRTSIKPSASGKGRGQHFVGKVWMIHKDSRAKCRVPSAEVSAYEARGYVKGGPRSK